MRISEAYEILKVSPSESLDSIKKAHKKLTAENHPDKVNHLSPEIQDFATKKLQQINQAYDLIKQQKDKSSSVKEIIVCSNGFGDVETITDGLEIVSAGGTISILPGLYLENVLISKNVEIIGAVDEKRNSQVKISTENSVIENSTVKISNVTFISNNGIIAENGSDITLTNTEIESETAGITLLDGSNLDVNQCIINNAHTGLYIFDGGKVLIQHNHILNCKYGIDIGEVSSLNLAFNEINKSEVCVICNSNKNDISMIYTMIENGQNNLGSQNAFMTYE